MIKLLILTNVAVFCAELFVGDELLRTFALWPLGISGAGLRSGFMPWQPLTYAFLFPLMTFVSVILQTGSFCKQKRRCGRRDSVT